MANADLIPFNAHEFNILQVHFI